jgi:hypothetical protein
MVVPNLEAFLRCYLSKENHGRIFHILPAYHMAELDVTTPLEMIDYIFRDNHFNRHLSAWDWETASSRLQQAGFEKVIRQTVNVSVDPFLVGHDKPHWVDHSLYVEAVK